VVAEAVSKKVDLIIAHHPFIFNGLKTNCFQQILTAGLADACPEMIVAETARDFIVNY